MFLSKTSANEKETTKKLNTNRKYLHLNQLSDANLEHAYRTAKWPKYNIKSCYI